MHSKKGRPRTKLHYSKEQIVDYLYEHTALNKYDSRIIASICEQSTFDKLKQIAKAIRHFSMGTKGGG